MVSPVYIRPLLALLVTAAVFGISAAVFRGGAQKTVPAQSAPKQLPNNIDVALKKARFSEIQDGLLAWELFAEQAHYDKDVDKAYLTDIRMEFQRSRSHGTVTVTADKGEYSSTTKNVRLDGHVHVVTEEGATFITRSLDYKGDTAHFVTRDPVSFQQQRLQLTAVGMDMSVKNQQARFFSSINASIVPR
jgi:LPS export ABC transporter protein LptC